MNEKDIKDQAQLQKQLAALESVVKQRMSKEAVARYGNIKAGHPEKAVEVLLILGQAIDGGKISNVSDDLLKQILIKITPRKPEFRITRR
jgi:DNA-binding TFAR19-related protein (PDSD5 family)